ncbi:MAG: hypothetical protein P0116_11365 [Candidatus Nitrosocosmicus sp.]|nr:hypothetical protein [Candidatus Nitrosocosmicus sp.]
MVIVMAAWLSGSCRQSSKELERLVYLDGYIPQDKKSAFDIMGFGRDLQRKSIKRTGKRMACCSI